MALTLGIYQEHSIGGHIPMITGLSNIRNEDGTLGTFTIQETEEDLAPEEGTYMLLRVDDDLNASAALMVWAALEEKVKGPGMGVNDQFISHLGKDLILSAAGRMALLGLMSA